MFFVRSELPGENGRLPWRRKLGGSQTRCITGTICHRVQVSLPGAPRAEALWVFALTSVFLLPLCDYVLPTALDGRLGRFRPALSCACANFDPGRRNHLFWFAKGAVYRLPT